jgi:hypothetical protein
MCDNDRVDDGIGHNGVTNRRRNFLRLHAHLTLSRPTQVISAFFLAAALFLIPWTVFLGLTLPPKYDAGNWGFLWIGFDVSLIAVLLMAAWAAWFRRQILAPISIVAGTLLWCDAWFDMVTSFGHRDEWLTLLTGFGGEVPLGFFFFWLYRQIVMNTLTTIYKEMADRPRPRRLRDFSFIEIEHELMNRQSKEGEEPLDHIDPGP